MSEKRDFLLYIQDIIEAMKKIEEYSKGLSFDKLSEDSKTIDAIIRNFEIIGEATKNIPKEIKKEHPEVPWKRMAGVRDKLIHEYFGVDIEILWKTVKKDLPKLKKEILKLRNEKTNKEKKENY